MTDLVIIEWLGVLWSVGEQDHGMYRCTVVSTKGLPAPGWHVGDHCWLTDKELHPAQADKETT